MKVIVSHDVDHWMLTDHLLKDLYLPKHFLKTFAALAKGNLSAENARKRISLIGKNRMERLSEVLEFDLNHGIRPTCFIGFANGLGLSYSNRTASEVCEVASSRNIDYFPHGIAFNEEESMEHERNRYLECTQRPPDPMGIRMHYLRKNDLTYPILKKLGYKFCSNAYNDKKVLSPYFVNDILEFPVGMMDVYEVDPNASTPANAIERSIEKIERCADAGLDYFTLIFHDHYFSEPFWQYREWYKEVAAYLSSKHEFTNFTNAYQAIKNQ